jgi:hypothetical protein
LADQSPRYVLLDANVTAGFYAPQTLLDGDRAVHRMEVLFAAVRTKARPDIRLLIPNFCIAEVFNVFSKRAFPRHTGKAKRDDRQSIHGKAYGRIFDDFTRDIHNAHLIEQVELNRYHILARHFIAPVDHHVYKKKDRPLSAVDQLIGGMAIWLSRLLGPNRFCLLTGDARLVRVLKRGRTVTPKQAIRWGLRDVEDRIGLDWNPAIYPQVIDVKRADEKELAQFFGEWPLPKKVVRNRRTKLSQDQRKTLYHLYCKLGVGRDALPYSKEMRQLRRSFRTATGLLLKERELWHFLLRSLKRGMRRLDNAHDPAEDRDESSDPLLFQSALNADKERRPPH